MAGLGYNNEVLICFYNSAPSRCLNYTNKVGWTENAYKLNFERADTKYAFNPDRSGNGRVLVVGGYFSRNTIEYLTPGGWKTSNVTLPQESISGCTIALNSTTYLIIYGLYTGGGNSSARTSFFNMDTETFTEGPTRIVGRATSMCSRFRISPTATTAIVTGGMLSMPYRFLMTTEFIDIQTGLWKLGPNLPYGIMYGAMVEHPKGGVLLVGGTIRLEDVHPYKAPLDTIYHLATLTGTWIKLPQKLKIPRYYHLALPIPNEITKCSG